MAWEDEMEDLAEAVVDAFGVSITITQVTSTPLDAATGARANTTAAVAIMAHRGRDRVALGGAGRRDVQEREYLIAAADLALLSAAISENDTLTDNGQVWKITRVGVEVDRKMHRLTCTRTN